MDIDPPAADVLDGGEPFTGLEATVLDFWRFAMGDLRTNNVRGYLAEFLVARAVGATGVRVEWDPWDVTAPDGTKIEVKASGYLQAWKQRTLSVPTFRVAPAYGWDAATGTWTSEQGFHADVYVLCLHTATRHEEYRPLDVAPWRFYAASRSAVEARGGVRMGLPAVTRIAGEPVHYEELRSAIHAAVSGSST
jgi:hypothetical protein